MPHMLFASRLPMDADTIDAISQGETFPGVSMPRVVANFSDAGIVLQQIGYGERRAEEILRSAAITLRKAPRWVSPDGRVVMQRT